MSSEMNIKIDGKTGENYMKQNFICFGYKEMTYNEFLEKLNINKAENINYEYTEGGAVKKLHIDGKEFKGTQVRDVFKLRSANFELLFENDTVKFKVKGTEKDFSEEVYEKEGNSRRGYAYFAQTRRR